MLGSQLPGALSTTPPRSTRPCWSSDLVDRARIDRLRCAPPRSVSCRRDSTGNGASRAIQRLTSAYFLFFSTPHSTVRDLIQHKVRDQNQRLRTDLR
ncbi:hypothetical protein EV121DRAFT_254921 [Schizophyllum commune]